MHNASIKTEDLQFVDSLLKYCHSFQVSNESLTSQGHTVVDQTQVQVKNQVTCESL